MPETLSVENIYAQIRAEFEGRVTAESRRPEKENIMFSTDSCMREVASEESFDTEMQNALREAEEMIKGLLLKGCPTDLILSW